MSVLACDRRGCGNIMCDRLSHEYGYICDECFDELCSLGVEQNIYEFMGSWKEEPVSPIDPRDYFNSVFPIS